MYRFFVTGQKGRSGGFRQETLLRRTYQNSGKTKVVRVPEVYEQAVKDFLRFLDSSGSSDYVFLTKASLLSALEELRTSLTLRANSGGAIKDKVRTAISLLVDGTKV